MDHVDGADRRVKKVGEVDGDDLGGQEGPAVALDMG